MKMTVRLNQDIQTTYEGEIVRHSSRWTNEMSHIIGQLARSVYKTG